MRLEGSNKLDGANCRIEEESQVMHDRLFDWLIVSLTMITIIILENDGHA